MIAFSPFSSIVNLSAPNPIIAKKAKIVINKPTKVVIFFLPSMLKLGGGVLNES